ncbi:MAG: GNAT family N-acetyltransferase [Gammaproteobacteria bacterium]
MDIEVTTEPSATDLACISQGIQAFNRRAVPGIPEVADDLKFAVFARHTDGENVGGIRATAFWGYLCIELLWLDETARGRGVGTRLVLDAEAFALQHGFSRSRVVTTSFQAKPFYEKLGYEVYGELEDCPEGHRSYYLKKQLRS